MAAGMRIGQLDSLRGIFALLVVAYHAPVAHSFMNASVVRNGSIGVNFFFVLSGFVIMLAYGERLRSWQSAANFMIARIGRLWPLHLFVMLMIGIYMLLRWAADRYGGIPVHGDVIPDELVLQYLRQTLMLHAFANDTSGEINPVSWSIAVEFWCYLIFACVTIMGSRSVSALAAAISVLVSLLVLVNVIEIPFGNARDGLWRALYYFTLGAIAYLAFAALRRRGLTVGTPVELSVLAAYGIILYHWHDLPMPALWGALVFAPGMVLLALGNGRIAQVLNTGFFRMLGERSYSIYMVHMLVLLVVGIATRIVDRTVGIELTGIRPWPGGEIEALTYGSTLGANVAFVALLALIVVVSGWTYRNIELPGQRAAKRWAIGHSDNARDARTRDATSTKDVVSNLRS
jgi:peptidoglycan/LPS O-acetylase OafA/YrhL